MAYLPYGTTVDPSWQYISQMPMEWALNSYNDQGQYVTNYYNDWSPYQQQLYNSAAGNAQLLNYYGFRSNPASWWNGAGYYNNNQYVGELLPSGYLGTSTSSAYTGDPHQILVPEFDFGKITPGWTQIDAGMGLPQSTIDILNQQWGTKINDWISSQLSSGQNFDPQSSMGNGLYSYGIQPGSTDRIYVGPNSIDQIFQAAGITGPYADQYLQAFDQAYLQGESIQRQMESAATKGDFMKFGALAMAMFGGAALLGPMLAGAGLGASGVGLEVAASDFAGMMAAGGFDAATIASSMASIGFDTTTIMSGLEAANMSTTGGLTGFETTYGALDNTLASSLVDATEGASNVGYDVPTSTDTSSLTDVLKDAKDVYSTVDKTIDAINAPTGSDIMDSAGSASGGTSGGTSSGGTTSGGTTSGGTTSGGTSVLNGGNDSMALLDTIQNTYGGLAGQEAWNDVRTDYSNAINDIKTWGDPYGLGPLRQQVVPSYIQSFNDPFAMPQYQKIQDQYRQQMLARDSTTGNLFNAPEREQEIMFKYLTDYLPEWQKNAQYATGSQFAPQVAPSIAGLYENYANAGLNAQGNAAAGVSSSMDLLDKIIGGGQQGGAIDKVIRSVTGGAGGSTGGTQSTLDNIIKAIGGVFGTSNVADLLSNVDMSSYFDAVPDFVDPTTGLIDYSGLSGGEFFDGSQYIDNLFSNSGDITTDMVGDIFGDADPFAGMDFFGDVWTGVGDFFTSIGDLFTW